MKIMVLYSSPNPDGLTAVCAQSAAAGITQSGAEVESIALNRLNIGMCKACDDGWGTCADQHECQMLDDFQDLHAKILDMDGLVLVTPVYWGEMSEAAKALTDRLRRCEANKGDESGLKGKPIIAIAAAGGSGGGMITCLSSMERWIQHVRARVFDLIPVNRWSRSYKLAAIHAAGQAMVARKDLQ